MGQEKFDIPLSFGEAGGFALLVIGTLIYNEIVVVPCGLMSFNTKREIAARDMGLLDGSEYQTKNDINYMASSPAAAYDYNRNSRAIGARMSGAKERQNQRNNLIKGHNDRDTENMYINEITESGSNSQYKYGKN